jgi:hypothetical protein
VCVCVDAPPFVDSRASNSLVCPTLSINLGTSLKHSDVKAAERLYKKAMEHDSGYVEGVHKRFGARARVFPFSR